MAFFKFRKGGDDHPTHTTPPNSVEAIRKRAKHRLIGASILVLLAVIGFPVLFDSQPRPMPVDVAIEIPDKNTVAPLPKKNPVKEAGAGASGVIEQEMPLQEKPVIADAPVVEKPPVVPVPAKVATPAPVVAAVAPVAQVTAPPKKEVKPVSESKGRFVVQIGAFADVPKAREARIKLEKAGFKTYTQVIENKDGRRVRVRVGPFETKADAVKAAEKIKKLDLQAGILEL